MSFLQQISREPVSFLFRKMWHFAKGHRHLVVAALLMSAVANLILLAEPLVFGEFLNEIQQNGLGEHNIGRLILILFIFLAIDLGFWLFHGPSRVIENIAGFRTRINYRHHLLSGVLGLGLSWHSPRDSGDTIDKVNGATAALFHSSRRSFNVIEVLVRAIGTTIILLFFNVYIGLMAFTIVIISFFIILQFDLKLIPLYKRLNIFGNRISARIFDALSNVTSVKVLHIEKPVLQNIRQTMWVPFATFKKMRILAEAKWFSGSIMFTLLVVLPLMFYILYLYRNNLIIEIGTISAMYLYLSRLVNVYFNFAGLYEEMIIDKTRIQNVDEVEVAIAAEQKIARRRLKKWHSLNFENVSFKYDDADRGVHHIDNVDFYITREERVALIGESGSGKSTFLKILHGMYPSSAANLKVDNREARSTNFADIDLATTLVPQEPEIFSSSIRENITLGLKRKDAEIFEMSDMAEFTQVLHLLPNGLDSVINEKGVNLSGGQKQRLALARALLFARNKEIILLDESTSSVDPETEVKIYQNIFNFFHGKTVLASIHKMNLLKYFDRIVMFANGEIVDEGTFDELIVRNAKFKKDWEEYIAQQKQESNRRLK